MPQHNYKLLRPFQIESLLQRTDWMEFCEFELKMKITWFRVKMAASSDIAWPSVMVKRGASTVGERKTLCTLHINFEQFYCQMAVKEQRLISFTWCFTFSFKPTDLLRILLEIPLQQHFNLEWPYNPIQEIQNNLCFKVHCIISFQFDVPYNGLIMIGWKKLMSVLKICANWIRARIWCMIPHPHG